MTTINSELTLPCGLVLSNRIAKASLTECLANPLTHAPNEKHVHLYRNWRELSSAGLLITGNVQIDSRFKEAPGNVAIENDEHLFILKQWASQGQSLETKIFVQISHAGRQCPKSVNLNPIGPSAVDALNVMLPLFAKPRAMSSAEVQDVIDRFVKTAVVCQQAGFSGVEIHAAHGYLLSQFLSPLTNLRGDRYGGDSRNRRRLLIEVLRAVRMAVGFSFAVALKINSADFQRGGFSETESFECIEEVVSDRLIRLDLLEISGGCYEESAMMLGPSSRSREAYFMEFVEKARTVVQLRGVPLMLTGGFRSGAVMQDALRSGVVDLIGLGRPFIMQPREVSRLLSVSAEDARCGSTQLRHFRFRDADLNTGVKTFNAALNNLWHQDQMHRLAQGKDPDYNMTFFWALTTRTFSTYLMDWRSASIAAKAIVIASCASLVAMGVLPVMYYQYHK